MYNTLGQNIFMHAFSISLFFKYVSFQHITSHNHMYYKINLNIYHVYKMNQLLKNTFIIIIWVFFLSQQIDIEWLYLLISYIFPHKLIFIKSQFFISWNFLNWSPSQTWLGSDWLSWFRGAFPSASVWYWGSVFVVGSVFCTGNPL